MTKEIKNAIEKLGFALHDYDPECAGNDYILIGHGRHFRFWEYDGYGELYMGHGKWYEIKGTDAEIVEFLNKKLKRYAVA